MFNVPVIMFKKVRLDHFSKIKSATSKQKYL